MLHLDSSELDGYRMQESTGGRKKKNPSSLRRAIVEIRIEDNLELSSP
jgi:hypothetical protein